jgi:hypothetical protein
MKLDPCFVKSWSTSGAAVDTNDSFIFSDTSETGTGGVIAAGDVDIAHPHHTPEWSNLRSGDPTATPGPNDLTGLPAVQMGDSYAGTHALYQDLFVPC